jgi:glycerol-3-phosphate dehydrogenase
MAQTVEDFLARRTRALLLDAAASIEMSLEVARIIAIELGKNEPWVQQQVKEYKQVAKNYRLN